MSSDESEEDEFDQKMYRAKDCEWRHPDITGCMDSIDQQRLGVPVFKSRGAKPVKRCRIERNGDADSDADDPSDVKRIRGGTISNRAPPDGLPRACYNPEWLSQPRNKLAVNVSVLSAPAAEPGAPGWK